MDMYKIAICAIIKDEHLYLKEWLDYHKSLGISDIYLYEDWESDSHENITQNYSNVYLNNVNVALDDVYFKDTIFVKTGPWRLKYVYDFFFYKYRSSYDWIMFIDIDEFLILKNISIQELLKMNECEPAIMLKWKLFGANGHLHKPKGNIMDNYTKPYLGTIVSSIDYKSIVNCALSENLNWKYFPHTYNNGKVPIDRQGNVIAYLNHYFTKSWEDWKHKILVRGDVFANHRKIKDFFKVNPDLIYLQDLLLINL